MDTTKAGGEAVWLVGGLIYTVQVSLELGQTDVPRGSSRNILALKKEYDWGSANLQPPYALGYYLLCLSAFGDCCFQ